MHVNEWEAKKFAEGPDFFNLTLLTAQVPTKNYTLANMNSDDNEKYHYLREKNELI